MTGDPLSGDLLPCDNAECDDGNLTPDGHVVNVLGTDMGNCARMCQVAHVLSRVHRHRAEHELDASFRLNEAIQLDRTLVALDSLLAEPKETSYGPEYADDAIAVCCSTRFFMYEKYASNEIYEGFPSGQEAVMQRLAIQGIDQTVARVTQLAQRIQEQVLSQPESASFLTAHALYYAASICASFGMKGSQKASESFHKLCDVLALIQERWRVAGAFAF
jgi:hypothetical protein